MAQLPEQKGEHTTKESDAKNARPQDRMERLREAFEKLVPGVDPNKVIRDSVRVHIEMGVATIRWDGVAFVSVEDAVWLLNSLQDVPARISG